MTAHGLSAPRSGLAGQGVARQAVARRGSAWARTRTNIDRQVSAGRARPSQALASLRRGNGWAGYGNACAPQVH